MNKINLFSVLEKRAIRSFQSLARMSDMFLRDVKADIDETDEEVLIVGDSYLQ